MAPRSLACEYATKMLARVRVLEQLGVPVLLRWVPGHAQVPGNVMADAIAEYAAQFGAQDVLNPLNGHIESHFSPDTHTWSPPRFVSSPYLSIHGLSAGLNYGQQAYEGLKAFRHAGSNSNNSKERITIFRPNLNARRLAHSAETVSIPPVPEELFIQCVKLAVAVNAEYVPPASTSTTGQGVPALYIRPLLFSTTPHLGLTPPSSYTFTIFVTPVGAYHGLNPVDALILESFDRAAPRGTGSGKVGGNYAPVLRHSELARREGFGITLHLDSQTRSEIEEFSTSGFIGVQQDKNNPRKVTLVVPDSNNIIDSVTSSSICTIGHQLLNYNVEKRLIPYSELSQFSEVMAAGTAAGLVPIRSITMKSKDEKFGFDVGEDGEGGGPICVRLLRLLQGIQTGRVEDRFGWLVEVDGEGEGVPEGFLSVSPRGKNISHLTYSPFHFTIGVRKDENDDPGHGKVTIADSFDSVD
ncbi:hypothetical protein VTN00DRAFT_3271 [Thermoascus crustaceus]|uniref:uncharacterized protein n=1 Tax=Thermoascus crustaceus TaxID=5088 RepID=UPI00374412D7